MYMVYLYIVEQTNIYRYGIYLILYIIILILDTVTLKKYAKNSYVTGILLTIVTMMIFTGEYITQKGIIFTLLAILFYLIFYKMKEKRKNKKSEEQVASQLSIGFFLGVFNMIILIFVLGLNHRSF